MERNEHAVLTHLVETCRDGEQGFHLASGQVSNPVLKTLFTELAAQRALFAAELLPYAYRMGGDAAHDGTRAAALHRGWMRVEQLLRHDDQMVVSEVERGDRATLTAYHDAIHGMLAPDTREVVERQYAVIEAAHARIPVIAAS